MSDLIVRSIILYSVRYKFSLEEVGNNPRDARKSQEVIFGLRGNNFMD